MSYYAFIRCVCPESWTDIRHLHTLIWMIIGLICSGGISLTKWTIYVDSRAGFAQSHQRRFSRWLHNPRINVQRLYSPIIQAALSAWGSEEIVLIEDTTLLWNRYCLGDSQERYYRLDWSDKDVPFGQKRISF